MTDPVFSERAARDEDTRAEALALQERDEIVLFGSSEPSQDFRTFMHLMMREVCRGAGLHVPPFRHAH